MEFKFLALVKPQQHEAVNQNFFKELFTLPVCQSCIYVVIPEKIGILTVGGTQSKSRVHPKQSFTFSFSFLLFYFTRIYMPLRVASKD